MPIFRGVNGANRELKEIYRGISGVNRSIKEIYRGVNGVNRQLFGTKKMLLKRTMNYPILDSNIMWTTSGREVDPLNGLIPPEADQYGGSPYYVKMESNRAYLILSPKDPIDLTQFSKVGVKWKVTFDREFYYANIFIYLGDTPTNQYLVATINTNTNGIVEAEFDISQYSGLKYLRFLFDCNASFWVWLEANVYDIWLR